MTSAEALEIIIEAGRSDVFDISIHCRRDSMPKRHVSRADIRHGLANATSCYFQPDRGTWVVTSTDRDDDPLDLAVALLSPILVVTVW